MTIILRKAAVHLNNAGVSLLRHGCLRQAIETFQEALAVAKLNCHRSRHLTNNDRLPVPAFPTVLTEHDSSCIRTILEKSYHRLSHPKPSTLRNLDLQVISDDENPAWIQSQSLKDETKSFMKKRGRNFVIHMDHLGFTLPSEEEMAIQCSIISYNHGVAYLCRSTPPSSRPFVDKLYRGAFKMFQLAALSLTSHHLMKEKLQSDQMNRVLITRLFVLRNLILLSTTLGMAMERVEYLQRLVDLKQSIHEFC